MVVEITPIGIESLGWRFYIIWTVFNAAFVPTVYFLYPETANRSLEDIDQLFRENHDILVFKDPDAVSSARPLKYIQRDADILATNEVNSTRLRKLSGKEDINGEASHREEV